MPVKQALKRAGKESHAARKKALGKQPARETIAIDTTRYELLRYARINVDGPRMRKVAAALDRLLEKVGNMPMPLLQSWQFLESGRLELQVAGAWLNPPFVILPLPLPLRSPTSLAILMFLMTIVNRAGKFPKEGKILFESLCTRLGIPTWDGKKVMMRSMDNALNFLNSYLESDVCKVDFIELRALPNNYVRFQPGERPQTFTEDEDEDEEAAEAAAMIYQDEDGNYTDADGNPVDEYGTPLDADGDSDEPYDEQQQAETEPRPDGLRPRVKLLSDAERATANYRNYLTDLLGDDAVANMSDQEVTAYVDRLYDLSDAERCQKERDLRFDTKRQAWLASKANMQQ